jgi:probable F420-dependent oxidoreductase
LRLLETVEDLGCDSAWATQHIAIPVRVESQRTYGNPTEWHGQVDWLEAMSVLGFAAAATTRMRLGTHVVTLYHTDPVTLAKEAATIDALSDGRFELGLGCGWLKEEAQALGHPTDHPMSRLREALEILRLAWTQESFSYSGRYYEIPEVKVHPHPLQGKDLPVWLGAMGPLGIQTAAEMATGVIASRCGPADVARIATDLRSRRATAALGMNMALADNCALVLEQALTLIRAGVDRLFLPIGIVPDEALTRDALIDRDLARLSRFMSDVLPTLCAAYSARRDAASATDDAVLPVRT